MKSLACCLIFCAAVCGSSPADELKDPQAFFLQLLQSLEKNDAKEFVKDGSPDFQTEMTADLVQKASKQLAPRMKEGYGVAFFGTLKKKDYEIYLWKLTFKDEQDELLTTVSIKDGKVVGFYIK